MTVSANYTKLHPSEISVVARVFEAAWQNPSLPREQYDAVVKGELEAYRSGQSSVPFDAFINLLKFIPSGPKTILDIGASSAYYSEVLKIRGFQEYDYTAMDFSTYYKDLAAELFPSVKFQIGTAVELPFEDQSFDVVLHGACLMHLPTTYEKAIQEAVRVSKGYVLFHRTPIYFDDTPTEAFVKTAYGVPCVESHFNETELVGLFYKHGLEIIATSDLFRDGQFGHRSYLAKIR